MRWSRSWSACNLESAGCRPVMSVGGGAVGTVRASSCSVAAAVGRMVMMDGEQAVNQWKGRGLDLSAILYDRPVPERVARRCVQAQDHGLEQALDHQLLAASEDALETLAPVEIKLPVRNIHRSVGTMLSGAIARRYGSAGLPDDTIRVHLDGSAVLRPRAGLAQCSTLQPT